MRRWWEVLGVVLMAAGCAAAPIEPTLRPMTAPAFWLTEAGLWSNAQPDVPLLAGAVADFQLAPDGAHLAAIRDGMLWIAPVSGDAAYPIDHPGLIAQFGWLDSASLLFTIFTPDGVEVAQDQTIYQVDLTSRAPQALASAGRFVIHPDGLAVALIDAGRYQAESGWVRLLADGIERELLRFPAVSSGSHQPLYPAAQWVGMDMLYLAIPAPDALYQEGSRDAAPVTVWHCRLSGDCAEVGSLAASLFGLPRWSPDGTSVIYLRRSVEDVSQFDLLRDDRVIATGESFQYDWVDPQRWMYRLAGQVYEVLSDGQIRPVEVDFG